jgi:hypothetical protein
LWVPDRKPPHRKTNENDCVWPVPPNLSAVIRNLTWPAFEAELRRTLSPSSLIRTPEFLRGRERNLEQIRRASRAFEPSTRSRG